jgi:YgiT-type zinc finger domain-containing protein
MPHDARVTPDMIRRTLTAWHATHPTATFAELEVAVEEQLRTLRAQLLEDYAGAGWQEEHPACPRCGTTMVPRRHARRTVIVQGEQAVQVDRSQVVCPSCGETLFPPG